MNLNQVTVSSHDLPASVSFYAALGLRQIVDSPHYARFECPQGDATFSVHLTGSGNRPSSATVTYFELSDVSALDAAAARLAAAGMCIDSGPEDQAWGWRELRLRDPSGNSICLYYAGDMRRNPPWRIDT